ncbi:hypothetical protein cce_3355 [Crocosphaera subtropica ATCC 51142]|uniref:HTTM domain-containing protein n=1 Tax=Crocosphaera subtropica (strain ATCC 51142 / BH68) TaxID=43989 RepID=B1WYB9_CROS5|nr:hypothetical protein [Crocosphaera subtropica]ACB52703.1 hypothetical protein cce_3355 [Crocosphaera subtropica ATCC 51142]
MIKVLKQLEKNYTQWLSSPAPNAAGRIGLFRILYSIFSLWLCSYLHYGEMGLVPAIQWKPILLLSWLDSPPYQLIPIFESLLVSSLILLLVGYQTRLATLFVFVLGSGLTAIRFSLFMGDALFMVQYFYIPLFMLFSHWGDTYSIDSILAKRQGKMTPQPQNSSWRYFWSSRGLLVVYTLLMFSSAFFKIIKKEWIFNPNFVGYLIIDKTFNSYLNNGFPVNPISIFIAHHRSLYIPMQYFALIFETSAILILFIPIVRFLFFRLIPIFHFSNTFLMGIPFATVIGIYLAFPDWQSIYERFYPKFFRFNWLNKLSSPILIISSISIAAIVGMTWNILPVFRYIFSWFGLVKFHTIWLIIFPFALIWAIRSISDKTQILIFKKQ